MSRLSIEISPKQHQHIKARAAMKGQSIKEFVMDRLFPTDASEEQSWKELNSLLTSRIEAAQNGAVSKKTIQQIAEDEITRGTK